MEHKQHKTQFTVLYLATGAVRRFNDLESAKSACFEAEYVTPVRLIYPLYY